jgi:hypothetical protein
MRVPSSSNYFLSNTARISDRQLGRLRLQEKFAILGQLRSNLAVAIVHNDLGAVSDKQLGVDQAIDLVPDRLQEFMLDAALRTGLQDVP